MYQPAVYLEIYREPHSSLLSQWEKITFIQVRARTVCIHEFTHTRHTHGIDTHAR